MALKKKPVTGMRDILPAEMQLRKLVTDTIQTTYRGYGFTQIETPCVEHIENLTSKQGGDNEKLIFKILKRGEKLNLSENMEENDLADSGLRYDLTLPLSRFYANNQAQLPSPFKALQMGSVWRADRPQKGRFRQFTQCDIDILGDASPMAETELILATTEALGRICPGHAFEVRINDRRLLKAMALCAGFTEETLPQVFITLDKLDKIGMDGVTDELLELGCPAEAVNAYARLLSETGRDAAAVRELGKTLGAYAENGVTERLSGIMDTVAAVSGTAFSLAFDPSLVRGMSYYTGTIFEVSMEGFSGSVAGGGRYDGMIGRFTGQDIPACGFSIGFERIISILLDEGREKEADTGKKAWLYEKGLDADRLQDMLKKAAAERADGSIVLVAQMNKNKKFQKEQLSKDGYTDFTEFYRESLK